MDCSPFLNWDESRPETDDERAFVFRSLVATVNAYPPLDDSLEAKAVKYLEYVTLKDDDSADAFLNKFGPTTDNSPTNFVQSIVVLLSSPNLVIATAAMKMLGSLILWCSVDIRLALVKADLLPQIIISLNPQSLSFAEAVDIHINLILIISNSVWLAAPGGLEQLGIEDENEQQAVHETVLKQVLTPLEQYIWHLCVNRFSIVDGSLSNEYLYLMAQLLEICPYHQPTMDFVFHMPSRSMVATRSIATTARTAHPARLWKAMHSSKDGWIVLLRELAETGAAEGWWEQWVELQPELDASREAKAVKLLNSLDPSHVITTATMKMLGSLIFWCSHNIRLALVKADLLPQLINTLNPMSLSFAEAVDIHVYLLKTILNFFLLTSPSGLETLGISDGNEQLAVHETSPIREFSITPRPAPPNMSILSTNT
ncbi:hypothetical protein BLNAU_6827 [Blattamonas nauphoetae]|uniref:Uncharacterized protein n=1 Tax=Blattamonas nauphoetae TaxID=2049346 RepID=A0ABQ9Y302_9EUKA|nr:hypothetical protein BLNAU_6827 [Blattamonas nauphoetae]